MIESDAVSLVVGVLPAFVRIAAITFTMPLIARRVVPIRVKVAVAISLSVIIFPSIASLPSQDNPVNLSPTAWPTVAWDLVNQVLIGSLMGISLSVVLAAAQMTGTLIEGLTGFSAASFGGSGNQGSGNSPVAQLFWWTSIAVFISVGGVGQVVRSILDSFSILPVGVNGFDQSILDFLVNSLGLAFRFGVSAALPAIVALLVGSIVLGMAQRNFPQLGGMQVGLNLNSILGMVVASAVLLTAPWVIQTGLQLTVDRFVDLAPVWLER